MSVRSFASDGVWIPIPGCCGLFLVCRFLFLHATRLHSRFLSRYVWHGIATGGPGSIRKRNTIQREADGLGIVSSLLLVLYSESPALRIPTFRFLVS